MSQRAVGDEAASELAPSGIAYDDRITAFELAIDATHAGRQQTLAADDRFLGSGVDLDNAPWLEISGDPALAGVARTQAGHEQPTHVLSVEDSL